MRACVFVFVAGLTVGCAPRAAPGTGDRNSAVRNIVITLEDTDDGCTKTSELEKPVRSRRDGLLRWHILNFCDTEQTVRIEFTEKDPTVQPNKQTTVRAVLSNGNPRLGRINGTVRNTPPDGDPGDEEVTYPYRVWVGTRPTDPEIIIDWRVRLQ